MKNTKKVIALVLAVVMLLGTMTMVAFAEYTATGDEATDGSVNIKFEVAQFATATFADGTTFDTSTAYSVDVNGDPDQPIEADRFYAVTAYAKCTEGIDAFILPVHFNRTHFEPIGFMLQADPTIGMVFLNEDLYEDTISSFTLGDAWTDTKMYNAAGGTVAAAALAKCIGLGNSNAAAQDKTFKNYCYSGTDSATADLWGVTATNGVVVTSIDEQAKAKNAYLNVVGGKIVNDWVALYTIYFLRKDGVAESACYGDTFGVVGTSAHGVDVTTDASGKNAYSTAAAYVIGTNKINITNAAVETPVKALCAFTATSGKAQQIMFNVDANATTPYQKADITSVDYRFVAQFSQSAFELNYDENNNGKITSTNIAEVGFVFARTDKVSNPEDLKGYDVATLSKDSGDVRKCWTAKVSTDMAGGASFAFSCRIKGVPVAYDSTTDSYALASGYSEYYAVPYVVLKDGTSYYGPVMTSGIAARCNAYAATFLGI